MAGRRHVAAPGEPRCPAEGCERPAGLFTDHPGRDGCLRHDPSARRATPAAARVVHEPEFAEFAAGARPEALDRRLTGGEPVPEPLAVVRLLLHSARRAGFPFEQAWALAAEAALSHMPPRAARSWWDVLDATERGWSAAYHGNADRLAELHRAPLTPVARRLVDK
jgi:hypothetical protein